MNIKYIFTAITLALSMMIPAEVLATLTNYEIIQSRSPSDIIVNKTYGDYQDVEIVVSGIFPNGCFDKLSTEGAVAGNNILIENLVSFTSNVTCNMVLVPYMDTVKIHNLRPGTYQVYVKNKFNDYEAFQSFTINP